MSDWTPDDVMVPFPCAIDVDLPQDAYPLLHSRDHPLRVQLSADQPAPRGRVVLVKDAVGVPMAHSNDLVRRDRNPLVFAVMAYQDGVLLGRATGSVRAIADPAVNLTTLLRVIPAALRLALCPDHVPADLSQTRGAPVAQPLQERFTAVDWAVGVARGEARTVLEDSTVGLDWLRPVRRDRFWADPCVVPDANGAWIYVEEFLRWSGRGRIVALRVEEGKVVRRRVVLSDEHHRALPRIISHPTAGVVATTDSCQVPGAVFTFTDHGQPWHAIPGFTLPPYLSDPQLLVDGDDWVVHGSNWLLGEDQVHEVYRAQVADTARWRRDDGCGFIDPRCARGAGRADTSGRAAQDCARDYGARVTWIAEDGTPVFGSRVNGRRVHGQQLRGMHTLDWSGETVVTDGWWVRQAYASPVWNRRELRHLQVCRLQTRPS